jgi:GNAT superfamily N-acetyltransferase
MTATIAEYPRELERTVTLRDGSRVHLRAIRPDDEPRLVALYDRLSQHTAYQRFFTVMRRLPPDWAHFFANVDYRRRLAIVAEREVDREWELVGVGRYEPSGEGADTAEVAFVVEDGWQGKGLGTILLEEILRAGEARGHRRFRAYVLADNHRMLDLLNRRTQVEQRKIEDGVVSLLFRRRGSRAA